MRVIQAPPQHSSYGSWKGHIVLFKGYENVKTCSHKNVEVLHHNGDNGLHFCPTGLIWCRDCDGFADEPKPYECNNWDRIPE